MYKLILEFKGLPKTTNANARKHWTHQWKESKKWRSLVALYASTKRPEKPLTKVKGLFIRYSSMEPDYDGLCSSFKHLIDGLVDAQIIVDDKISVLESEYKWVKVQQRQGYVRMEITEKGG